MNHDGQTDESRGPGTAKLEQDVTQQLPVVPPGQEFLAAESLTTTGSRDQSVNSQGFLPSKDNLSE
jgi:hypothetical protein